MRLTQLCDGKPPVNHLFDLRHLGLRKRGQLPEPGGPLARNHVDGGAAGDPANPAGHPTQGDHRRGSGAGVGSGTGLGTEGRPMGRPFRHVTKRYRRQVRMYLDSGRVRVYTFTMDSDFLDIADFTASDVLACVPGLGRDAFGQWVKRGVVSLSNSGRGRGPKANYSASDIVQVATIYEIARQGILASKAAIIWQMVVYPQLLTRRYGLGMSDAVAFLHIHPDTDELMAAVYSRENPPPEDHLDAPGAPDVFVIFQVDRFISRMFGRMARLKSGEAVIEERPRRTLEQSERETLASMGLLDERFPDRIVLIGLTPEESEEYRLIANEGVPRDKRDRYTELGDKHQEARGYLLRPKINKINQGLD